MNDVITQFSQLFIHYYSQKSRSACKLFISTPQKSQEAALGKLFGIVEFHTPSRENGALISQLIAALEEHYYARYDEGGEQPEHIEHIFESALADTNASFAKLLHQSPSSLVGTLTESNITEKINLCVGVVRGTELHIAHLNAMGVYLVHKGKQDYSIVDILKTSSSGSDFPSTQLFSHVLSGTLVPDDYLFVANKDVFEFISLERIKKIVSSLPPHKAAEYFKNALLQYEGYNFAAIIVHTRGAQEHAFGAHHSLTSIGELNKTESATEKLLSPSLMPSLRDVFGLARKKDAGSSSQKQLFPSQKPPAAPAARTLVTRLFAAVQGLVRGVGRGLRASVAFLFPPERFSGLYRFMRLKSASLTQKLTRIPNMSKLLLVLALISAGIFIYSIVFLSHRQSTESVGGQFQEQMVEIENSIAGAQSNIIIGDEQAARAALVRAQEGLSALTVDSSRQKQEYQRLTRSIEALVSKLRHITVVEPSLIAVISSGQSDIRTLVELQDKAYAFDLLTNSITEISISSRDVRQLITGASEIAGLTHARIADSQILLYTNSGFYSLNAPARTLTALPSPYKAGDGIRDFAVYSDRLYTLNPAAGAIVRTSFDNGTIAPGVLWLRESIDLADAVGMGVDSSIWIAKSTGSVIKLTKGARAEFALTPVEPAIETVTDFFTSESSDYLYMLEPANRRIIVHDKDGAFITQYYSDAFSDLKSFFVDERGKKMLVVNSGSLYAFPLTHIK